jgi:hypothetical protein
MALQVMFVLLLVTIVHVVATVPAAGPVSPVASVAMSQPVYSLHDAPRPRRTSLAACSSIAFFILGGAPVCLGTTVSVLLVVGFFIAFD